VAGQAAGAEAGAPSVNPGPSIVKHVIARINGTIEVESQLGKGSTFIVLRSPTWGNSSSVSLPGRESLPQT
jgi:light-regulated signal transduction histidine kinase (bacteriophytochrome)